MVQESRVVQGKEQLPGGGWYGRQTLVATTYHLGELGPLHLRSSGMPVKGFVFAKEPIPTDTMSREWEELA
uniref:HDC13488 n=1 Tax=Drosophila melanogaster TaxID=7227 RepID=Q6IK26_DROME|nr:TPA_inf: HDC13488 [Drosophila melanogaster]